MKKLKELIRNAKSELSYVQSSCEEYDNVCKAYSMLDEALEALSKIEPSPKSRKVTADHFNYCVGELTAKRLSISKSTSKQITDYLTGGQ